MHRNYSFYLLIMLCWRFINISFFALIGWENIWTYSFYYHQHWRFEWIKLNDKKSINLNIYEHQTSKFKYCLCCSITRWIICFWHCEINTSLIVSNELQENIFKKLKIIHFERKGRIFCVLDFRFNWSDKFHMWCFNRNFSWQHLCW